MLDIKAITRDPTTVAQGLEPRGIDTSIISELAEMYDRSKKLKGEIDETRATKKKVSQTVGQLMKDGKKGARKTIIERN